MIVTVFREGDRLRTKVTGEEAEFELTSLSDTKFHLKEMNFTLTFVGNDRGEFNEIEVKADDNKFSVKRIDPFQWDKERISDYVGIYYSTELQTFYAVATRSDEDLILQHQRMSDAAMTPKELDKFVAAFQDSGQAEIVFTRDAAGKVSGYKMNSGRIQNLQFDKVTIQPIQPLNAIPLHPPPITRSTPLHKQTFRITPRQSNNGEIPNHTMGQTVDY